MKCFLLFITCIFCIQSSAQIEGTFIGDTKVLGPYDDGDCRLVVPFFIYKVELSKDGHYKSNIIEKAEVWFDDEMISKYCIYINDKPYQVLKDEGTYTLIGDTITFTSTLDNKQIILIKKTNSRKSSYSYIHVNNLNQNIGRITINNTVEYYVLGRKRIPEVIAYPKKYLRKIKVEYMTTRDGSSWTSKEFHIHGETDITISYDPNHDKWSYRQFEQNGSWRYSDSSIKNINYSYYLPEMKRVTNY